METELENIATVISSQDNFKMIKLMERESYSKLLTTHGKMACGIWVKSSNIGRSLAPKLEVKRL